MAAEQSWQMNGTLQLHLFAERSEADPLTILSNNAAVAAFFFDLRRGTSVPLVFPKNTGFTVLVIRLQLTHADSNDEPSILAARVCRYVQCL